jgi:hypothetical protein
MLYQILVGDFVTGQFETLQYSKVAGVLRYGELDLRLSSTFAQQSRAQPIFNGAPGLRFEH